MTDLLARIMTLYLLTRGFILSWPEHILIPPSEHQITPMQKLFMDYVASQRRKHEPARTD